MNGVIKILAIGLFAGYSPIAPGTIGTLVGVLLFWAASPLPIWHYIAFIGIFILFASYVADKAQFLFGVKDPKPVVIDEIAGFLVTMAWHAFDWKLVLTGFILFRMFDILKPFPIRQIERRLANGFGIVLDDVMAGIYANVCLAGLAGLAGWKF